MGVRLAHSQRYFRRDAAANACARHALGLAPAPPKLPSARKAARNARRAAAAGAAHLDPLPPPTPPRLAYFTGLTLLCLGDGDFGSSYKGGVASAWRAICAAAALLPGVYRFFVSEDHTAV